MTFLGGSRDGNKTRGQFPVHRNARSRTLWVMKTAIDNHKMWHSFILNDEEGMTRERLSLRKIREILRLKEETGLSNRAIGRACKIPNSTVGEYLRWAKEANMSWPLPDGMNKSSGKRDNHKLWPNFFGKPCRKCFVERLSRTWF